MWLLYSSSSFRATASFLLFSPPKKCYNATGKAEKAYAEMRIAMDILIILQQMIIIFLLIGTGMFLYRRKMLSESASKDLSSLIVNVTNPALLICSAFSDTPKVSLKELGIAFALYLAIYVILIVSGFLIPRILRVPTKEHYVYKMLSVFGNVGFIGIPLASAVLGTESLIFVSIYNLLFNILIYTYGISTLQKVSPTAAENSSFSFKKCINAGTISALVTVIFYLANFDIPVIISSTLEYAGRATTLLSMLVLGISVAKIHLKDIFCNPRLYGFTVLRQILLPIGCILLFRPFVQSDLILHTLTLMLAVPAANMPLMLSTEMNLNTKTISQGIILTTILSLVTIPLVSLFL